MTPKHSGGLRRRFLPQWPSQLPLNPQTPSSGGLRHRTQQLAASDVECSPFSDLRREHAKIGAFSRQPGNPVSSEAKKVVTQSRRDKYARTIQTNLPKSLPIMMDEIALIGPGLSEFLASISASDDTGA